MEAGIICVPYQMDVARWGYALGPRAFLDAGLMARLARYSYASASPAWMELPRPERTRDTVTNLGRIAARTSASVAATLARGALPVVLEGDCTHAVGAIGGLSQAYPRVGVLWFDAHGDLHTMATTTSGYIGGMPYAVALGWDLDDWRAAAGLARPVPAEACALLGTSDLDDAEIAALGSHPILHRTARDLTPDAAAAELEAALATRAGAADAWYLHLDLDVAGPEAAPGGLTPAPSWPPRERLVAAVAAAARALPVRLVALATYNPGGDPDGRAAELGLDLLDAMLEGIAQYAR
jgi:arginase